MFKALKYIPFLLLLFNSFSFSQTIEEFRVDSIRISGNEITENYIILREMNFHEGDLISSKDLEFNRERIFSLGIFNRVELERKREKGMNIVDISVKEAWYVYPVPFLDIDNNDLEKASYGMILLWKNFRGRNETLNFVASFGYDPKYIFSYYNPLIEEKNQLSLGVSFGYQHINNKSLEAASVFGGDFLYESYSMGITLGKRLNPFNEIFLSSGFEYITQPSNLLNNLTATNRLIDRNPFLGLKYTYDTRDLKQFSTKGTFSTIEFAHKGFGLGDVSYYLLNLDLREYRTISDGLTARWRIDWKHLFGQNLPYYDRAFLGYREMVRGHKNDYREGENLIITSFELVYPLLKEWNFSVKLPLLPRKLTSMRIGINFELFVDSGTTFNNGERIDLNKFDSGYGAGLIILFLPHNAFRFEVGIDEYRNTEFLIGTGFSF